MIIFSRPADLHQQPLTFWSVTLQPPVAGQAAISHMKGDIHSFQMRHIPIIYYMRLQRYQSRTRLFLIGLVTWLVHCLVNVVPALA